MQLFGGNYARLGLPYGFFGQLLWAYYATYMLPMKVFTRNRTYVSAFANAVFAETYFFVTSWWWAVIYKIIWPELLVFDIEEIKNRGTTLTMAEATAIHYFGEDCGTEDCQSLGAMIVGQVFDLIICYFYISSATQFFPQLI